MQQNPLIPPSQIHITICACVKGERYLPEMVMCITAHEVSGAIYGYIKIFVNSQWKHLRTTLAIWGVYFRALRRRSRAFEMSHRQLLPAPMQQIADSVGLQ